MKILSVLFVLLLSGCASIGEGVLTAGTTGNNRFSVEDVDAAIVIAQQTKDPVAENCFRMVRKHLDTAPKLEVKGVASAYMATRARVRESRSGLAEEVHVACAPLVVDAGTFSSRLGFRLGF